MEKFGIGDYLRIISFLPNLNFKKIFWISDKKIHPFIKLSDRIDKIIDIKNPKKKHILIKSDLVLNLYLKKKSNKKVVYLKSLLTEGSNIKKQTIDLYKILSKFFKLKNYKIFYNKKFKIKTENDIFINWIVPEIWKIKSYPKNLFKILESDLKNKFNKKIEWQNETDSFESYVKKIKRSKIIVSVIGLGCHLAMVFNKPLLALAGPTYFNELNKYPRSNVFFPEEICKMCANASSLKSAEKNFAKPCNLRTGVNNCSCMNNISYEKIIKKINSIRNV